MIFVAKIRKNIYLCRKFKTNLITNGNRKERTISTRDF